MSRCVRPASSWRLVRPDGSDCRLTLRRATAFAERLRGLLRQPLPALGHGLWLEPCASVHSFGMRAAIDLLFVDSAHRVIKVRPVFVPWRTAICRRARSAIEMRAGEAARLRITVGCRLESDAVFPTLQEDLP